MGDSSLGTELRLSSDKVIASAKAKKLSDYNSLRKKIEKEVETEAMQMVANDEKIICVNSKKWHEGVIGIVASKLTEKFNRPSIVISEKNGLCKASCRSVNEFDIGELIFQAVQDRIIEPGGGHKMAAGFSIKPNRIDEFKRYIGNKYNKGKKEIMKFYDSEIKISSINNNLYFEIEKLSPFGPGNPRPKFLVKGCFVRYSKIVGEEHISFFFEDIYGMELKE